MWARIGTALKNNLIFYAILTVRLCPMQRLVKGRHRAKAGQSHA